MENSNHSQNELLQELEQLKARVSELEDQLAQKSNENETTTTNIPVTANDFPANNSAELTRDAPGKSVEMLRRLLDSLPIQIGFYDRALRYRFVNAEYSRFFGRPKEQIEGRSIREFVGETTWARLEPWMQRAMAGERVTFEDMTPDKHGPGLHSWTEETYIPQFGPAGRVEGFFALVVDITERKQAEEALRQSQATLQGFYDTAPFMMGIGEIDEKKTIAVSANQMTAAFFGKQAEFMPGQSGPELGTPPDLEALWLEQLHKSQREGQPVRFEYQDSRIAATPWFSATVAIIGTSSSERPLYSFIAENITERKQRERQQTYLLKLADALRPLSDAVEIERVACRLLGEELGVNRAYYVETNEAEGYAHVKQDYVRGDSAPSLVGSYSFAEYGWVVPYLQAGETVVVRDTQSSEYVPDSDRAAMAAIRIIAHISLPLIKADKLAGALCVTENTPREWTALEVELVRETAERIWATIQRAYTEEALRESEVKYRTLFETMDQGFGITEIIVDEAGHPVDYRMLEINPQLERLIGQPREKFLTGRTVREVAPELGNEWYEELYGTVALTGEPAHREISVAAWERWFEVSAYRTGAPQQRRVAVLYTDITERKRAEEALCQSEVRFRMVANLVPDLLWDSEPSGATNWYNQRWLEYTGQTFEEAIGWGWTEVIHPHDRETSARRYREAVEKGVPLQQEHRIRRYDGEYRWFVVNAAPLKDENGKVLKVYGAATDIHPQRIRREELEKLVKERTAELAEANRQLEKERERLHHLSGRLLEVQETERRNLARELHDEIGQYLTGLKFMLERLNHPTHQPAPEEVTNTLVAVNELTLRVRELSLNLRPTLLDDLGLVEAILSLIQRYTAQTRIKVEFYQHGLEQRFPFEIETAVYRVVQEALTNVARHAQTDQVAVQLIYDSEETMLNLLIQDEGQGFGPEQLQTSHSSTGLSAMRERVELVGGELTIESAPGSGTSVIVEIPATPLQKAAGSEES